VEFVILTAGMAPSTQSPDGALAACWKSRVPLLACPAVYSGEIEALLDKPAVAPGSLTQVFFNRLLERRREGARCMQTPLPLDGFCRSGHAV